MMGCSCFRALVVNHVSRIRGEQHLATALCRFRDRFSDLVETVGGGDRGGDRPCGNQRRQI